MSITNQVISNFPTIANYDANGNILGLNIQSSINSVTSNVGGLVVGNIANSRQSIAMGLGNLNIGGGLSVGGNANISNNLTVTGTLNSSQDLSVLGSLSVGNISAASTNFVTVYSNLDSNTSNSGAFVVTSNISNVSLSTSIGNGNITTGGNINVLGNRIVVTPGATSTSNNTPGILPSTLFYGGSNTAVAPIIQLNGANSTYSGLQLLALASERWFIGRDNSSNVGNFVVRSNASTNNFTVVPGSGSFNINLSNTSPVLATTSGNLGYQSSGGFHNFNGVTLGTRAALIYNTGYTGTPSINSGTLYYPAVFLSYRSCSDANFGLTPDPSGFATWTNNSGGVIWVLVSASMAFSGNASGIRRVIIYRNGSATDTGEIIAQTQVAASTSSTIQITTSGMVRLNNGDQLNIGIIQTSGATLTIPSGNRNPPCVSLVRI
jgi:hypothetical protein